MSTKQQAWLTAINVNGKQVGFVTENFEEVFTFKKICKENNIPCAVRFKQVEKTEASYFSNLKGIVKSIFS